MSRFDLDRLWLQARSPYSWPVAVRRAFLLGLPVAAPLALLVIGALAVALAGRDLFRPLARFWNAPPRRITSSGPYDYRAYERRRRRIEKVADIRDEQQDRHADIKEAA